MLQSLPQLSLQWAPPISCATRPQLTAACAWPENNTWDRRFAVSLVQHLGAMGHVMLLNNN
jgi:hypothetical protein